MKGRGESGNAMLDLSVSGLANVVVFIGGWLGVAGSEDAGKVASATSCRPRQCFMPAETSFENVV